MARENRSWGYTRMRMAEVMPTVEKLEQLLKAIAPDQKIVWRIAA